MHGFTPMSYATWAGHLAVCKWLFEAGAHEDISRAAGNGMTPMHFACMNGNLRVCLWLYANGAASDMVSRTEGGVLLNDVSLSCVCVSI